MAKHKHAEVIKAWAGGAEIEYKTIYEPEWQWAGTNPDWLKGVGVQYRVRPEKVYPGTTLSDVELYEIWTRPALSVGALKNVANAAIRHAIDAGQVIIATVKEEA